MTRDPGDEPLFPGYDPPTPEPVENLSADRRRTLRQQQAVSNGQHPLTGGRLHPLASTFRTSDSPKSDPFTCGSCYFRVVLSYHGGAYPKCVFDPRRSADNTLDMYARVSHSAATDVRAWWPACPDYSPSDRLSNDAARYIPEAVNPG